MGTTKNPIETLYENILITYTARFIASRRLGWHERLSLWTIALFSVGLIILALFDALKIPLKLEANYIVIVQIAGSITILLVSILLSGNQFSVRADRMHRCGLELSNLGREVEFLLLSHRNILEDEFSMIHKNYANILTRYDNHSRTDYKLAILELSLKNSKARIRDFFVYIRLFGEFSLYWVLLILVLILIAMIIN